MNPISQITSSVFKSTLLIIIVISLLFRIGRAGVLHRPKRMVINDARLTFYFSADFKGSTYTLDGVNQECLNFSDTLNDKASSLQIPEGVCVQLYEHSGCQGINVTLTSSSVEISDLGLAGLNDQVSSIQLCTPNLNLDNHLR